LKGLLDQGQSEIRITKELSRNRKRSQSEKALKR